MKLPLVFDLRQSFKGDRRLPIGFGMRVQSSLLYLSLLLSVALHWAAFLLVGAAAGNGDVGQGSGDAQQLASFRIHLVARSSAMKAVHLESNRAVSLPTGAALADVAPPVQGSATEVAPSVLSPESAAPPIPPEMAVSKTETLPTAPKVDDAAMLEIPLPPSYYFNAWELTAQPLVLSDTSADQVLELAETTPQPLIAHLLINENGDIDQIVLEPTTLSEEAQQFVIAAFSKTRFSPGKLGDKPVKTDLMIEIRLDAVPNP